MLLNIPLKLTLCLAFIFTAPPATAKGSGEKRLTTQAQFQAAVLGYDLKRAFITLTVTADGKITGRAFGRAVTGDWTWQDGYFCRSMLWGDRDIGYNCQEVRQNGDTLTFQSDRGTGMAADFTRTAP